MDNNCHISDAQMHELKCYFAIENRDILVIIIAHLDVRDYCAIRATCKFMREFMLSMLAINFTNEPILRIKICNYYRALSNYDSTYLRKLLKFAVICANETIFNTHDFMQLFTLLDFGIIEPEKIFVNLCDNNLDNTMRFLNSMLGFTGLLSHKIKIVAKIKSDKIFAYYIQACNFAIDGEIFTNSFIGGYPVRVLQLCKFLDPTREYFHENGLIWICQIYGWKTLSQFAVTLGSFIEWPSPQFAEFFSSYVIHEECERDFYSYFLKWTVEMTPANLISAENAQNINLVISKVNEIKLSNYGAIHKLREIIALRSLS